MGVFLLGCPTPVNNVDLAKGTTVLRGCKLKSIMCQVHTNQVLSIFGMLCNLITLPTSPTTCSNKKLKSFFLNKETQKLLGNAMHSEAATPKTNHHW